MPGSWKRMLAFLASRSPSHPRAAVRAARERWVCSSRSSCSAVASRA